MSDWQPIETAPKDGTRVLLANKHGDCEVATWNPGGAFFGPHWMSGRTVSRPTLWCAIPPLPEQPRG